jgi:uncharacterized protein (DUF2141 family)
MKLSPLYILSFLFFSSFSSGPWYTLKASIHGIENIKGKMAIQVLKDDGEVHSEFWLPVESKEMSFEVNGLVSGNYAVKFFHDTNWMGVPIESFGFSNDPRVTFGLPDLEEMLFPINSETEIRIKARKFSL